MNGILKGRAKKCTAAAVMFVGLIASAIANAATVPGDVPRHAAEALALAHKWRPDAMLIQVQARQSMDYALEFGFRSPSTANRFSATYANGRMISQVQPPVSAKDGGAIALPFLDLPAALLQAKQQGMSSSLKEASLDIEGSSGGRATLTWSLQANTDHYPYVFTVNANLGAPPVNNMVAVNGASTVGAAAPLPALPTRMAAPSPAAEALFQRGTTFYERKDYRGALAVYSQAANLGHPRAMAVLGNMYYDGQGVSKNLGLALKWYTEAAMRGNRGAQYSLAGMYEEGEGVAKNVPKAAQLYEASARQGMPEAQFALGLSYEFGEGVPRNRRTAIFWLDQAARQGDGRAKWNADWLSRSDTPQFRDEAQLAQYTNAKVSQGMAQQMGAGNRAPIGTLNGFGPTERSERAATLDAAGETNRAAECRSSGHC
jgi:tetratricopeptide (TPR) repeat protein